MGAPSDREVDAYVQQILAECDAHASPAVDRLRERAALLSADEQNELVGRARRKNPPLMASSPTPGPPVPPGVIRRTPSAAGT